MTERNAEEAAEYFEDLNPNLYRGARHIARQGNAVLNLSRVERPPEVPEIPDNIVLGEN